MPLVRPTVWTMRRKWLGNLIPALVWLPFTAAGVAYMAVTGVVVGTGLWLLIAATVLGWLAVNQLGFYENARMRRQLQLILESKGVSLEGATFVGMATPKFSSMIDPHEDVGFLMLLPDRLRFVSEVRNLEIQRDQLTKVRFRPNVHTILCLGRWVSVEGVSDMNAIRILFEPRERRTLFGNLIFSKVLAKRIGEWFAGTGRAR